MITNLKELTFKTHAYDSIQKLIISDEVPEEDVKIIKREYRKDNIYFIDEFGWRASKTTYILHGQFDYKKVPVHELTLFTSEIQGLLMKIGREKFNEYKKIGMPYSDYEEFEENTSYSGPIFDELTTLTIDDVEIPNLKNLFKTKYGEAVKQYEKENKKTTKAKKKNPKSTPEYAVIGEKWIKRSWYKLTIYEEFDFSKLHIYISRDMIFPTDSYRETFSLGYDDKEFEFYEADGTNADSCSLITSDGKEIGFNLLDEEDKYKEDD